MAISKTEVIRKKQTRGAILYLLYISQTAPMMLKTIELSMLPENPHIGAELLPQINWLLDRGYITQAKDEEKTEQRRRGDVLVRITDKGQDALEGTKPDYGLIVPDA